MSILIFAFYAFLLFGPPLAWSVLRQAMSLPNANCPGVARLAVCAKQTYYMYICVVADDEVFLRVDHMDGGGSVNTCRLQAHCAEHVA